MKKETVIFFMFFAFVQSKAQEGFAFRALWGQELNTIRFNDKLPSDNNPGYQYSYSLQDLYSGEILFRTNKSFIAKIGFTKQYHEIVLKHQYATTDPVPHLPYKTFCNSELTVLEAGVGADFYVKNHTRIFLIGSYLSYVGHRYETTETMDGKTMRTWYFRRGPRHGFMVALGAVIPIHPRFGIVNRLSYSHSNNSINHIKKIPMQLLLFDVGIEINIFKKWPK